MLPIIWRGKEKPNTWHCGGLLSLKSEFAILILLTFPFPLDQKAQTTQLFLTHTDQIAIPLCLSQTQIGFLGWAEPSNWPPGRHRFEQFSMRPRMNPTTILFPGLFRRPAPTAVKPFLRLRLVKKFYNVPQPWLALASGASFDNSAFFFYVSLNSPFNPPRTCFAYCIKTKALCSVQSVPKFNPLLIRSRLRK